MYLSLEPDYQSLPVRRALRIKERMQLDSTMYTQSINPLAPSPRENSEENADRFERQYGTKLYWSKVDIVLDDAADEPHFCTAQP